MQIPTRRSEQNKKAARPSDDRYLTVEKMKRLEDELRDLKERQRPKAVDDLSRAREMGDLSENAAYSEARSRLGRIDNRVLSIQERLKQAVIIESGPDEAGRVRVGSSVIVRVNGRDRTYEILGSQETDPARGRISYLSPLGAALVGKRAGDNVTVSGPGGDVRYDIIDVR